MTTVMSSNPAPRSYRSWYAWMIGLMGITAGCTALCVTTLAYLSYLASQGASGTEFMVLLLIPVVLLGVLALATAGIVALIHLLLHRPRIKGFAFSLTVIVVALLTVGGTLLTYVQSMQAVHTSAQQSQAKIRALQAVEAPKPISTEQAKQLLAGCEISQFYYGDEAIKIDEDADKSSTGVLLTHMASGQPWRISAGTRTQDELLPLAQEAASECGGTPLINRDTN